MPELGVRPQFTIEKQRTADPRAERQHHDSPGRSATRGDLGRELSTGTEVHLGNARRVRVIEKQHPPVTTARKLALHIEPNPRLVHVGCRARIAVLRDGRKRQAHW